MELPTPDEVASAPLVYKCGGRRVVSIGDIIVKFGETVSLQQAESTSFVASNTTIPVPRILKVDTIDKWNYIYMTRLPGIPLSECLPSLSASQLNTIALELRGYLDQLRGLRIKDHEQSEFIGSLGGAPCMDRIFCSGRPERGPFKTEVEMYDNICDRMLDLQSWGNYKPDNYNHILRRMYKENSNHTIKFTHGDLSPTNILVQEGHVTGILDWEEAGWYPEYWEYIKTMQGCATRWETLWPLQIEKFLKPYDYMRLIDLPVRTRLA
jgi:aminoglycoside phosphotransferase